MKEIKQLSETIVARCMSVIVVGILMIVIAFFVLFAKIILLPLNIFAIWACFTLAGKLMGFSNFLGKEIDLMEERCYEVSRSTAVKMKFESFLKIYQSIPQRCTLMPDAVYFSIPYAEKESNWMIQEDRMFVYFDFFNYLKYARYMQDLENEKERKKESQELEVCIDIIRSLKSEVEKSKEKSNKEMVDAYNNFVEKVKTYTNAADVDDWELFKGTVLDVKYDYKE